MRTPDVKLTTSPAQWTTSALLLVAAATHVPLIGEHMAEAPYVGWLFVLLAVVCIELAIAILFIVDDAGLWVVSGLVCLAAMVAFMASRTVGLPQIGDDVGNWTEPLGFPAVVSEVLVVVLATLRLRATAVVEADQIPTR